ncbi:MAG: alpha-amylase family glycosyl hydrolase [Acidimicrobiia bacterium]|nr:alpha-amylase family glycosyl hydrolase [Acidimicrobiia bacterium]
MPRVPPADPPDRTWWRDGVLYQVYPRSFADSNGDGVGDLRGIVEHLDHLAWLGVDGVWITPVTVSPDDDWGYDVADYTSVQPALGTLDDLDELLEEAARHDIRVILDLVPNHTSVRHPWFLDARSSRTSRHRDWYVWADPGPDGSPPNNWLGSFGGSAWTLDEETGQYYLHNFLPSQADLNWWNEEVREEFDRILRFWFDRGVAGFRIDVCHMIVKDRELRDNPPTDEADHWFEQLRGQRQLFNAGRPEVHDVLRRWRAIADSYDPPRVLLGETHVFDPRLLASFYGRGDELNLAFNFLFMHAPFGADGLAEAVQTTEASLPPGAWPLWAAGDHDYPRFPTRWCGGDPDRARAVLVLLLTLRGTPILYYGDELGLPDTDVPRERLRDPVSIALYPVFGRDPARTPMPWRPGPGAGFTDPGVEPWLPLGDRAAGTVEDQRDDPSSTLHLCRDLIRLRAEVPDLRREDYEPLPSPTGVWAYRRGPRVIVAANLGDEPAAVDGVSGTVRIATRRDRDGTRVRGRLELGPSDAVVLEAEPEGTRRRAEP